MCSDLRFGSSGFAGLFFGTGKKPLRWSELGWQMLCEELPRQILADGVDFEASVPYHRLVTELFFFPALYRKILGLEIPGSRSIWIWIWKFGVLDGLELGLI